MTWLFAVRTSVLVGSEIKNCLYSNLVHAFCLIMLTTFSFVLNPNKLCKNRKAHPKQFLVFTVLAKLETFGCQQRLAMGRSSKLILVDSNRGIKKWWSVKCICNFC